MKAYSRVYAALAALTCVTAGASFLDMGAWSWPVALAIAGAKAALVAIFFMRLNAARLAGAFVWIGLLCTALLLGGALQDFMLRR